MSAWIYLHIRSGFLGSDLGKWILALLAVVTIGSLGMAIGVFGLMFYAEWFSSTSLPNQLYMAFRLPTGIAVAYTNFQIAMERYFLICHEQSVPRQAITWIGVHAGLTMITLWVCAATAETTNFRRPGGTWQPYLTLICIMQYMALSFGGLTFLYAKTYIHVSKMVKSLKDIVHGDHTRLSTLRMRVLSNCILMTLAYSACYSTEAILTIYSMVTEGYIAPSWLDSLATAAVSCDTVFTPLLVMHLHSNVFKSSFIIGSRLSQDENRSKPNNDIIRSHESQRRTTNTKADDASKSQRSSVY
ncbi:hypothetical protein BCR33DRAFT_769539 [Rhizoclosmatium globosum]|uniref:Serpentine receptor class gamma n=1 Tax=Rhizoclosmatium globosum TaxID=329046 RepID=A0A1Y2BTA3_9FUNG|nr:hypothetical protein BCR33DRAFT_769539 [Rhizoclosmatium globosum]|eukprot:ORY37969.1 hypothetical protein BCR33DRAFT_769539 [Rhizoclosmatium globosum]